MRADRADLHVRDSSHGCMTAHILFRAGSQPQDAAVPLPALPPEAAPVALDDRLRELETNLITWALKVSHATSPRPRSC